MQESNQFVKLSRVSLSIIIHHVRSHVELTWMFRLCRADMYCTESHRLYLLLKPSGLAFRLT